MARVACDALFRGWCLRPESNRYARFHEAADFKSAVSTNFTTQAENMLMNKKAPGKGRAKKDGGAGRSRTDLLGFAIRYITALLPRRNLSAFSNPFGFYGLSCELSTKEKGQHFDVLPF
jgi:hypothetical protein